MLRLLVLVMFLFSVEISAQSDDIAAQIRQVEGLADKAEAVKLTAILLNKSQLSSAQRVDLLLLQTQHFLALNNFEQALQASQAAGTLASKYQFITKQALANKLQGVIYYYQGLYDQSIQLYKAALSYYQRIQVVEKTQKYAEIAIQQANLLNNIALVQTSQGNENDALISYQQAEPLYQQFGSEEDKIDIRYNIATLHISLRRFDLAITMLKQVLTRRIAIADHHGIAMVSGDLGVSYKYSGQYLQAKKYNSAALAYFQQHNHPFDAASQLHNLAEVYFELGEYEQSLSYATQAATLSKDIGHQKAYVGSLHALAKLDFYFGNINQANRALQQANTLANKMNYQQAIISNLGLQALIFAAQGKTEQALEVQSNQQGIAIEQANELLNEKLARFESEQLTQQVENLQQAKELQQLQATKDQQQRYFTLLVVAFILMLLFLIYRRYLESRLTNNLEKGVKQRTEALEFLTQELQYANQVKSQFLANMSHEIRTPLTAVIGQSEAIIHGDLDQSSLTKEVEVIHSNSLHLLALINDILDISKIEANKFELEERQQDLHHIISELEVMFTEQAARKHLAFSVSHHLPSPLVVNIDGLRLKQILINLCSNAIKFTDQGWVTLDISIVDKTLYFTVTDTGIGMNKNQMSKIFNSFTQADNSISRRFAGSGLGLFLSMQLAKVMSGDIVVTSQEGQGSSFVLKLPFSSALATTMITTEQASLTALPLTENFAGKILLAEDHADNRRLIARLLTKLGLEVIEATNGKEAVEQFMQHQPTLALMDIQMPEMDGIEALQKLRKFGCTQPIYVLTANAMSHEISHYLSLGFTGHLKKPIERNTFIAAISRYYPQINESINHINNSLDAVDISDIKQDFLDSLPNEHNDILSLLGKKDLARLARITHQLAGAAEMFGYSELSQSALELEQAISKNQHKLIDELTHCLLDELNLVVNNPG